MPANETNAQNVDDPDADIDRDGERVLSVEDIGKRFSGLQALDDVDMATNRGGIIGLIGSNGTGKTTLFNYINGAFPLTNGTVRLDDEVISGLSAHRIARAGLARTLQITCPLGELAIIENAMVGAHIHTRRRNEACGIAMENLEFVRLTDKAEEEASELAVGAQKRPELARVVSTRPGILLLDEVMAGLIPSEPNQILDLFRQFHKRRTSLLIVEHDMKTIMNISDYMKVPDQGKGIAFGAPETMVKDDHVTEVYTGGFDVDT